MQFPRNTPAFRHQYLDVYKVSLDFARWSFCITQDKDIARSSIRDQLNRASESVVLNIAEGAQQSSKAMSRKHYRIALASAAECAAIIDLLALYSVPNLEHPEHLIQRIGQMLRVMIR